MSERIEDLQCGGLKILQDDQAYTFTSDSVVLANFVKAKKNDVAVEIGAGCGVISILVQHKTQVKKIFAFEIQEKLANLARKNVELNGLQEKIQIVQDDVKNHKNHAEIGRFGVVFSNPPFHKVTDFAQNEIKKIAKEEVCLSCEQLCKVASELLGDGGNFYVCYPAQRCVELICNLSKHKLEVKEMFFTENGKGEVKLVVLRATKAGRHGCKVHPNLVTNDENGDYLEILKTENFGK